MRRYPTRTCVACRTERQKRELVRIVRAPAGDVALDRTGRAQGRGAYLCADGACWSAAARSRAIERALQVPTSTALQAILAAGPAAPAGAAASEGDADGT